MFRSHRGGMLAALIVLALLTVAACGSENGSQGNQSGGKDTAGADGSTEPAQSATMAEKTENGEQKDRGKKNGGKKGGVTTAQTATGAMKVRDGTFRVDQADTVEFQVSNDALDLRDVSPSSGWRQQTAAQSSDASRCISLRATCIGSSRSRSTPTAWISPRSRTSVRPKEERTKSRRPRRGPDPIRRRQ
jgi:hypothetical protein